jgi:hypothetical protein
MQQTLLMTAYGITGVYLGFRKGMVSSFKKGHLLPKKGTSPGRGHVFATHSNVKVIFWGFFYKTGFWTLIEGERRVVLSCFMNEGVIFFKKGMGGFGGLKKGIAPRHSKMA